MSDSAAPADVVPTMADAAEMLWVVLANVSGGDWTKQSAEWQETAARWRDNYFAAVKADDLRVVAPQREHGGLVALREIVMSFKNGTKASCDDDCEVDTIQKTLNVVLAEIDKLARAAAVDPPPLEKTPWTIDGSMPLPACLNDNVRRADVATMWNEWRCGLPANAPFRHSDGVNFLNKLNELAAVDPPYGPRGDFTGRPTPDVCETCRRPTMSDDATVRGLRNGDGEVGAMNLPKRDVPALIEALRIRALALTGESWERDATRDMMKEAADRLEDGLRVVAPQQEQDTTELILKPLLVQLRWALSHTTTMTDQFTANVAEFTGEAERALMALRAAAVDPPPDTEPTP